MNGRRAWRRWIRSVRKHLPGRVFGGPITKNGSPLHDPAGWWRRHQNSYESEGKTAGEWMRKARTT